MKYFNILAAFVLGAVSAGASSHHARSPLGHHHDIARRNPDPRPLEPQVVAKRSPAKRCKKKPSATPSPALNVADGPKTSPAPKAKATPKPAPPKDDNPPPSTGGSAKGLISVKSTCGDIGATRKTTATTGPNGKLDWLNCGLNNGGWNPPNVKISDIVVTELSDAVNQPGSPFKACSAYIGKFNKYAAEFGIPPIMIASFAMQESSCVASTTGGGGEVGLMQITREKCNGAPGGNCYDPDFNIRTGARFFADSLKNNGGNVILTVGSYNGWYNGLTTGKATAAAHSSCCRCQNNLDYLHQYFNGWLQNINAYDSSIRLGRYFNLDKCN